MKKNSKGQKPTKAASRKRKESAEGKVSEQRISGQSKPERFWIGLDLGDQESTYCVLDEAAEVVSRGKVKTREADLKRVLGGYRGSQVAMEVGTHSSWISRVLEKEGLEVVVANARKVRLITESRQKNDAKDAEDLARLLKADPKLLSPVVHRSEQAQKDLIRIRARAVMVEARTKLINAARGLAKSVGMRLKKCDADQVGTELVEDWDAETKEILTPLLTLIEGSTLTIKVYDRQITDNSEEKYPETQRLTQVPGVGTLTATTFVLTLDDKHRIKNSRQVGPLLGMTPARKQSSGSDPERGISKEGNPYVRTLLVQSAQWILSARGPDCELKRFGQRIAGIEVTPPAAKPDQHSRKRKRIAVVAVARKLGVLLHRLWVTGEDYDPFYATKKRDQAKQSPKKAA
jgi:transposase